MNPTVGASDAPSHPPPADQNIKPPRLLACAPCSRRKIRCDRIFPCANCVRSHSECIPATLAPRRRRKPRIPERDLLDRLRQYEQLLRQNNIAFEPLHKLPAQDRDRGSKSQRPIENKNDNESNVPSPSPTVTSDNSQYEVKYALQRRPWEDIADFHRSILDIMTRGLRHSGAHSDGDSDSSQEDEPRVSEVDVKGAWDRSAEIADHLPFSAGTSSVDISTLHPGPVHIFKLWQVYLDNVNPLLKVTHTPTLQGRIIEAASNVASIDPVLEALMFSIYCVAILSLGPQDCQVMFGASGEDLLLRYQFAAQQALLNCSFLRTKDRDCMTALLLYLISFRPNTVPQSLHAMFGVAGRIAHRLGIHSEAALAKCTIFEAQMRRRLWWSFTLIDTRITQLSSSTVMTLDPTWDCSIPLNLNDSDLRPEMNEAPVGYDQPTESLFTVVRCEVADFIRHTDAHLDFTTPSLKPIARHLRDTGSRPVGDLAGLEEMIENKYFKNCDPENPIHFMTMWTTRSYLAKCHLMDHVSKRSSSCTRWTRSQRDATLSYALRMIECDTKVMTSPLTRGFRWLSHFYFPFLGYIHILQDLKTRPPSDEKALQAWEVMSENYHPWFDALFQTGYNPVFSLFANIILEAWAGCSAAAEQAGETLAPPSMIFSLKETMERLSDESWGSTGTKQPDVNMGSEINAQGGPLMLGTDFGRFNPGQSFANMTALNDDLNAMMNPPDPLSGSNSQAHSMSASPHGQNLFSNAYIRNQLEWTAMGGWPGWETF